MEYIEQDCTFTHEGKSFESGGAVVTPTRALAYMKFPAGEHVGAFGAVTDWHGKIIGSSRIVASWRTPRSYVASRMFQIEAVIDDIRYAGRGCGDGMIWRGKRSA